MESEIGLSGSKKPIYIRVIRVVALKKADAASQILLPADEKSR
jgi:hypothetical protein